MPRYKYIARNKEGKAEESFQDAQSQDELVGILQARSLTVVTFKEATEETAKISSRKRRMHSGVKIDDLITFSRQLSTLLGAGITLLRSLEIISLQIESKRLFDALEVVKKDVSAGNSLKATLAKHPKVFSKLWVNIVETGETTGQLPFALEQLTTFLESSATLTRKIKSALVYPIVVLCVAAGAVTVFIVKIIPMFANIYSGFDASLPVFTDMVFTVCLGIKKYLLILVGLIVALVFGIRYYGKTHEGRKNIDKFKLSLPVFGDVIRQVAAVRFASGLNMLIKSGTPILHALDIVIETSGNVIVTEMLQKVKENVREGKSMAEPLIKTGIFPDMLAHMVAVGEESGELANMLENASKFYEERVDATVSRMATLFEPLLIVFIGAIVGTLVIAMFLPIFGLSGVIGG
ncbi:MAG: type II secretion system F family protein [Candidatus Omnitrophica bacterium]|nr:type II secretion system F family protein [Candidatus Omnitrophota bacterium]